MERVAAWMSAAGWSVSTVWNLERPGGGWMLDRPTAWAVETPAAELVIVQESQDSNTLHCLLLGEAAGSNRTLKHSLTE